VSNGNFIRSGRKDYLKRFNIKKQRRARQGLFVNSAERNWNVSPAIEFQFRWLLGGMEGGAVGFGLCKINCIDRLGRKVGCAWDRNDVWSLKSG
jgi:hypothetical protein